VPLVAPGDYTSVDIPDRAGHPTGIVAEQKVDGIGDIFRCANASNGVETVEGGKRFVDFLRGN